MGEVIKLKQELEIGDSTRLANNRFNQLDYHLDQIIENQIRLTEILNGLILDEYKDEE